MIAIQSGGLYVLGPVCNQLRTVPYHSKVAKITGTVYFKRLDSVSDPADSAGAVSAILVHIVFHPKMLFRCSKIS
jgi:hypothetical protein